MTPLLLSLHLSVASARTSYDQLPLTSLTDDAPRGRNVDDRYSLPEKDTTNGEADRSVDLDKRDHSCVKTWIVKSCGDSKYRTVVCRSSSLTSCHSAIPDYGTRKCKVTQYTLFPKCGDEPQPTACGCAS